ncbi:MAG TPA: 2-oxoacid:acceptor oxidoreductase family protein [Solirubrobacterales bacterium]|nr:2-oxoacid:acceptor oxidoreductase family protein [Solirubrobacterales bacterium]
MFQVRFHGRGGQGVVTAAELLSIAAFEQDSHAQAFPTFGSERMGAPVISFCRIDDKPIRVREPISEPDALVIQDPTLIHQVDLFNGLAEDGYVLLNSSRDFEELGLEDALTQLRPERVVTLPATEIAREHVGRPLPNAVLLGGLAALTGVVSIESVEKAIHQKFTGSIAEKNARAARVAHDRVTDSMKEPAGA